MTGIFRKAIVILILLIILFNSPLLLTISSAVDEMEESINESKVNVLHEINLEKYINYAAYDDKVTLVQVNLKTGVEFQERQNYYPIKKTLIALNLPKIGGEYPNKVEVIGISTKATNGNEDAKDIKNVYNDRTGEIKIETTNETDDEGNIYSEYINGVRDEYKLVLYYSSQVFNARNIARQLEMKGTVQVSFEKGNSKLVEVNGVYNVTNNISGIISTDVHTSSIYNGAIKANKENGASQRTEYVENVTINPSYKNFSDEVQINLKNALIDENNIEIETNEIIYKSTKIDKDKLVEQLGEDGYLQILDENGNVLGEVNKDTETGENGIFEINYENEISNIIVKISKIKELKGITIQNEREIKETVIDTDIHKIQTKGEISCFNNVNEETKELYHFDSSSITEIKKAETRVDLSVNKQEFTNSTQNDVIFTADLITDNVKFNLFKNPVLEIKLPTEVENVILGEVSLLYGDDLSISSAKVINTVDSKVIRIEMQGVQDAYILDTMVSGPHIVIPAAVIVKKDIESVDSNIDFTYYNESGFSNDYTNQQLESKRLNIRVNSVFELMEQKSFKTSTISVDNIENILDIETIATVGDKKLENDDEVHEEEYIEYYIKLKNTTNTNIENIKVVGEVPQGSTFVEFGYREQLDPDADVKQDYDLFQGKEDTSITEYNKEINLDVGEEKELYYYVKVNKLKNTESHLDLINNIKLYINNQEKNTYTFKNVVKKAEMNIGITAWETDRENNLWLYKISVGNNTDKVINNPVIDIKLPKELKYNYLFTGECNDVETSSGVQFKLTQLNPLEKKEVQFFVKAIQENDDIAKYEVAVVASVAADNISEHYSQINRQIIYNMVLEIIQKSDKEGKELNYGEEIEYIFTIINRAAANINQKGIVVDILSFMDENMQAEDAYYETYESDLNGNYNKVSGTVDLKTKTLIKDADEEMAPDMNLVLFVPVGSQATVRVKAKADIVTQRTEVFNSASIVYKYDGTRTKTSNIIKNIILPYDYEEGWSKDPDEEEENTKPQDPDDSNYPDNPNIPDDPENPENPESKEYSISGYVWIDDNRDGKRDIKELTYENMTIRLFDANTNTILKDQSGNDYVAITDNSGKYEFTDVVKGNYFVVFEYDNSRYTVTTYKKSGVSEQLNSDVVNKLIVIDGIERDVGITDILNLNEDKEFINMGLTIKENFDLSINKTITRVSLRYSGKNKEYNYNETKLAKVEIPSKSISNSSLTVEYKLEIKNEGDVEGYVNEVVDYMPEGFGFSQQLNLGWSKSSNGILKNVELIGQTIKPGESKIINLYLTKNMTGNSVGSTVNEAGILKSSSINGDINIGNNKDINNNDYSKAELIISIKTGALFYTGIILLIVVILIVIKVLIDKKIINIRKIKHFCIMFIFITVLVISNSSFAFTAEDANEYARSRYTLPTYTALCGYKEDPYQTFGYNGHKMDHPIGELYCTDGAKMAIDPDRWSYTANNYEVSIESSVSMVANENEAKISNNGSNPQFEPCDSEHFVVGPYKVEYTGTIDKIEIYKGNRDDNSESKMSESNYELVDSDGRTISSITSNKEFYIKVKKSVTWIPKVYIHVSSEASRTYRFVYHIFETWTTPAEGAQVLGKHQYREWNPTEEIFEDTTAEINLPGPKLPLGNLRIKKIDQDTGNHLNGWRIRIVNEEFHYDKTFTIKREDLNSNGYFVLEDLPAKLLDEKIEYTITEVISPSGYDILLQKDSEVVKETKLNIGGSINLNIKNKQYGDLSVIKVDYSSFDKMNGVGFIIYKEESDERKYIKDYKYKENEPATVTWTTNVTKAMCFYTGIQGENTGGYIVGNCTAEDGRILLKNLPVKDGSSSEVIYNAVEYKFDYDKNPDLINYKLDKTRKERLKLKTNAYNNTSSDNHQSKLIKYTITEFYTSDYIKRTLKDTSAEDVVRAIYQAIMGKKPNSGFIDINVSLLNATKTKEGYDQDTIKRIIDSIYSDIDNISTIVDRAKGILKNEDNIVSFMDYLFSVVGIKGDDIKDAMKNFTYYTLKSQTVAIMKNKQHTIDIRGLVWEDIASSKDKLSWTGNSLFHGDDKDTEDEIVTGITVKLYAEPNQQGTHPTVITETTEEGYKFKGSDFVLDERGNKVLDENGEPKVQYNILIENLSSYWIEFEYNGLKYKNVLTEKQLRDTNNADYKYSLANDTSKAKEKQEDRTKFNESFSEIVGNTSSTVSKQDENNDTYREVGETTGYSKDVNSNDTNGLKYESIVEKNQQGEHTQKSILLSETEKEYNVASMQNKVFNSSFTPNTPQGIAMRADTSTAGCNFMDMYEQLPEGAREIKDVNLGISAREQPDLAVASDLNNIQLSINGYNHTYYYGQRFTDDKGTINSNIINTAYDILMNGFSVAVKRNGKYRDLEYEREVYDSYIAYTKELDEQDPTNQNKLKMYVNYTILVKNESSSLVAQAKLRNYADSRLQLVSATFEDGTQAGDWGDKPVSNIGDNMSIWETKNLISKDIPAGESIKLNLRYEVPTSAIIQMAEPDYAEKGLEVYANLTEIVSYSTWNQDGERYAGIDKDSAPNNISYGNTSTYEDDTDAAPRLKIKRSLDGNKQISGTVFEDSVNGDYKRDDLMTGEKREGNGKCDYDENGNMLENGVKDVGVELLNYNDMEASSDDNVVTLYTLGSGGEVITKDAKAITDDKGEYNFVGLIPGKYYLRYTYGKFENNGRFDGEEIIQTKIKAKDKGENEYIDVTTEEYKSSIVRSNTSLESLKEVLTNINSLDSSIAPTKDDIEASGSWYWFDHINHGTDSNMMSTAVDDEKIRDEVNESLKDLNYEVKTEYQSIQEEQGKTDVRHWMYAYTGAMNVAVEDYDKQISENVYDENKNIAYGYENGPRNYEIKFGIIERPRQSLQVTKEISNMSLTLPNGHVLAQGDPRTEEINYVTYPDGNRLKIEIDSELIQGSKLVLEYDIRVYNRSECDYDSTDYYRYGDDGGMETVDLSYVIADYADENLKFNNYTDERVKETVEDYDGNGMIEKAKWQLLGKDGALSEKDKLAGIPIWKNVYKNIKNKNNILIANSKVSIKPGEESTLNLIGKTLLSSMTDKDTLFNNHVELIQVTNPIGRFYGNTYTEEKVNRKSNNSKETDENKIWEATKTGEWKIETPGNYDLTKEGETGWKNEGDNNAYIRAQSTIVPPLGETNIAIFVIVGFCSLLILAVGIILIKKKVLK